MSYNQKSGACLCERCGYDWIATRKTAPPGACAKCKSKVWNTPRVYTGKYSPVVMAKRFKKTGRAAAKNSEETEQ